MDLSKIQSTAHEFEVKHPGTNEGLGFHITTEGTTHPKVAAVLKTFQNRNMNRIVKNKPIGEDVALQHSINIIVAAATGWRFDKDSNWNGEQIKFTTPNLKMILEQTWLREQWTEVLEDDENFFKG